MAQDKLSRYETVGVRSEGAYLLRLRRRAQKAMNGAEPNESSQQVVAYVNHGRWVADCPRCQAGIAIVPEQAWCGCLGCCTRFSRVVFLVDPVAVEAALLERPDPATRNWNPDETVAMLIAENVEHIGRAGNRRDVARGRGQQNVGGR